MKNLIIPLDRARRKRVSAGTQHSKILIGAEQVLEAANLHLPPCAEHGKTSRVIIDKSREEENLSLAQVMRFP